MAEVVRKKAKTRAEIEAEIKAKQETALIEEEASDPRVISQAMISGKWQKARGFSTKTVIR